MKIFFVNTANGWGGGERWHLETALSMKERGHNVTVMARNKEELFNRALSSGVRTIPVRVSNISFLNPVRILKIRKIFSNERPDIVILNFSADIKTVGVAARLAGIKNVIYRRGNAKPIRNTFFNRFLYQHIIEEIIANSEETRKSILKNNAGLFPFDKIKVIYNGIHLAGFDSLSDNPFYKRKGAEIIIGSAGRLSPEKGHRHLIDMAVLLKQDHIQFTILLAGEGSLEAELKKTVIEKGIEAHFIFLGFVQNMKAFMENLDIFVLPSLWEGFGYVSIEAMACRKPVVCFAVGSNPEIVIDHQTGLLVKAYDVHDMADKVKTLISDSSLRESMGKAGRVRVEKVFGITGIENEIEQFLIALSS